MLINIVHANLIEITADAIVNSAGNSLLGGCGVDEAVHQAAGPELLEECRALGGCKTGRAKVTGAYGIRCKYIIHTVVPTWRGGFHGERKKLASCYRTSLELALEHGCESIAFPLLGAGSRGYPKDKALRIALDTIDDFLSHHDDREICVDLVIHDRSDYQINPKLSQEVTAHLNQRCLMAGPWTNPGSVADQSAGTRRKWSWWPFHRKQTHSAGSPRKGVLQRQEKLAPPPIIPSIEQSPSMSSQLPPIFPSAGQESPVFSQRQSGTIPSASQHFSVSPTVNTYSPNLTSELEAMLGQMDEGFSQTLLRLIDKKGMTDAQCYKRPTSTASCSQGSAATQPTVPANPQFLRSRWLWN